MNADTEAMADLGGPLSRPASDEKLERFRRTFDLHDITRWVVTNPYGRFLGYCGIVEQRDDHPLGSHHEIGWRLVREAWGCGYASAAPLAGGAVQGVLYTLSERDAARMDFYEVVPVLGRYRRTWVEQGGERLYYYQTMRPTAGLKPTSEYLGYILDGLASHPGVDAPGLKRIAVIETGRPGEFVVDYRGELPAYGPHWMYRLHSAYRKLEMRIFLNLVYRLSLTEHLIRRPKPPAEDR